MAAVVAGILPRCTGGTCLAEIGEQPGAAAIVRFGQRQQRVEFAALHLLEFFLGLAFIDHAPLIHHIRQPVGHPGVSRQAVTPAATGFLIVAFDVLRQIEMGDKAHVGLVDAHAESNGGNDHHPFLAQEAILMFSAQVGVQPGVVGQRGESLGTQPGGGFLDLLAREAIDDACLALVLFLNEAQQLPP